MISLQGVSFTYNGGPPIFQELDLEIGAGQYLGLIGPNGSGKTTLAQLLNGLLIPTAGRVTVNGLDTAHPPFRARIRSLVG
ncbi:MAG: energy-coupling factor ABC transporter ATP-binding protein, partial [Syntrophales bacterium]|nr:energy-coupling factor ABC transporter ATP-binding protein [Syntrophales bacterium]